MHSPQQSPQQCVWRACRGGLWCLVGALLSPWTPHLSWQAGQKARPSGRAAAPRGVISSLRMRGDVGTRLSAPAGTGQLAVPMKQAGRQRFLSCAGQNPPGWQRLCHVQGHLPVYNLQALQGRGAGLRGVTGQQGESANQSVSKEAAVTACKREQDVLHSSQAATLQRPQ